MIIGVKNIGKSTLAEYLLQSQPNDCVLLDCDIGRNSCLEGCVSLSSNLE
jgi:polynucleotide 5'-kinase involved in rRNA processing